MSSGKLGALLYTSYPITSYNPAMNYKESKEILAEIKKAETILLNCHRGPDPDSIGSALALYGALKKLGKKVVIICPSDELPRNMKFLKNYGKILKGVDFAKFDFSKFDLFIVLDSSSWGMVSDLRDFVCSRFHQFASNFQCLRCYSRKSKCSCVSNYSR